MDHSLTPSEFIALRANKFGQGGSTPAVLRGSERRFNYAAQCKLRAEPCCSCALCHFSL